jgi:membrane protein required for colicin V production
MPGFFFVHNSDGNGSSPPSLPMLWIDLLIIGIIALSAIISLIRGFVREALSLVTWIAAFWVAWFFFRPLAVQFEGWIEVPSIRLGVAYGVLLIAVLLLGALLNHFMTLLVNSTGLTGTDRLLGVFFGAARGAVVVAILILLAGLTPFPADPWWHASQLIPYFQELALWLKQFLPADIAASFKY